MHAPEYSNMQYKEGTVNRSLYWDEMEGKRRYLDERAFIYFGAVLYLWLALASGPTIRCAIEIPW